MHRLTVQLVHLVFAACLIALPAATWAQAFPAKPLRIVTQFVPGSSGDSALRIVSPVLSESLGQPVVIENRPGAGGIVAAELVVRAAPDGYTILSSEHHLSAEQIMQLTGVSLVHVPYKSGSQAMLETAAGQLPMAIGTFPGAQPMIGSGKLKPIAVVSEKRVAQLPKVPTVGEAVPGLEVPSAWTGMFGPAGLAQPLVRRLNAELNKALNDSQVRGKLLQGGYHIMGGTPEQFAATIKHEIALIGKIVKAAGIKPE